MHAFYVKSATFIDDLYVQLIGEEKNIVSYIKVPISVNINEAGMTQRPP